MEQNLYDQMRQSVQLSCEPKNTSLDKKKFNREKGVKMQSIKRERKGGKSSESRRNRRSRTVFTNEQIAELKYYFFQSNYANSERAEQLAAKLSMESAPVRCWFKNQRRKIRIKENEKQLLKSIGDSAQKSSTHTVIDRNLKSDNAYISSLISPPTPSPSVSDVGTAYSYDPSYYNPEMHEILYNTANQWFQQEPLHPKTYVQNFSPMNVPNFTVHLPQTHAFAEPTINFNQFPYCLPSPKTTVTGEVHSMTPTSTTSDTSDYYSMSPDPEIIEPLTPKSAHSETVFHDILDSLQVPKTESTITNIYPNFICAPEQNSKSVLEDYKSNQSLTSTTDNSQLTHYLELV